MEQLNMFGDQIRFPRDYDDLLQLFYKYIYEDEKDDDVFTWNDIQGGRSYFFYGKKCMEFSPASKKPTLKVIDRDNSNKFSKFTADSSPQSLENAFAELKERKRYIFRNLIEETFGCCNDYRECSAVDHCIHPEDRFYNGCIYRTNLEAGRNFYKEASKSTADDNFTNIIGLDFETANASRSSACAVAAVKINLSGEEIDSYDTLINPDEPFDIFNVMIHGITPSMVEGSPRISEAMKNVFNLIDEGSIVVCHNAAFDMSVLRNSLSKEPIPIPDFYFTCTYRLASRVLPKNVSYTLPDVADQLSVSGLNHHDAKSDAATCAKILLRLIEKFDNSISKLHITANLKYGHFINGEYDGIHKSVKESDSNTSRNSSYHHEYTVNPDSPFYKKYVSFTGKLESMTRGEAIDIINSIGGFGCDSFTKKTDFLITGYQNPGVLAGKEKSSKRIAAEKMLASGKSIEIIPEEDFLKML